LSVIYRDAFAVLDAIGWRRPEDPPAAVDVPFTAGFVQRDTWDRSVVDRDRQAAQALDRLLAMV
jgi:hypothetical protein